MLGGGKMEVEGKIKWKIKWKITGVKRKLIHL